MTKKEIGQAVMQSREAQKLTLTGLAKRMIINTGTTYAASQIRSIEDGEKAYSIDLLVQACKALGLKIVIEKDTE